MPAKPLFTGLVFDENDQLVETTTVGTEPCYVVDDDGFRRHIPSEQVDRQVLNKFRELIEGHEEILGEQALKMLGQDDIFTRAIYIEQFKNIDKQFDQLLEIGYPEEIRTYMGMTGFKVIINHHGEVIEVKQPGLIADEE
jgi:sulfite reductase alpha subunit-like flavoprotein